MPARFGRYIPWNRSGYLFEALLLQWDIGVPAVMVRKAALDAAGLQFDPTVTASEEYYLFM